MEEKNNDKVELATEVYEAHPNNYSKGRSGYKICKFTPHIMAGILTAKQCCVMQAMTIIQFKKL